MEENIPEVQPEDTAPQQTEEAIPQQPEPLTQQPEEAAAPDIETLLREAEQRGYLRGRNELIENLRDIPQAWPAPDDDASCHLSFMNRPRTSIWQ